MYRIIVIMIMLMASINFLNAAKEDEMKNIEFVYIHGFGERRFPPAFEKKTKEFFKENKIPSTVKTYRWDSKKLNPTIVVKQWQEAKNNADVAAKDFAEKIIRKYEKNGKKYVLVGYSLGSRVVTKALELFDKPLKNLAGIYFLGAAQDKDLKINAKSLPKDFKIINYYSDYLDTALKVSYYVAEGKEAGGEVGFTDTDHFVNYRTVSTHVHKGGPIQRDYSDIFEPIVYLTFMNEGISIADEKTKFNLEMKVGDGLVNWNDVYSVKVKKGTMLFQQNVNTDHYRAVFIDKDGKRTRKAWGGNLHTVMKEVLK